MDRDEFKQLFYLSKEIAYYQLKIEKLRTKAEGCTQQLSDMPKGGTSGKKIEDTAIEIAEVSQIRDAIIRKRERERVKLLEMIEQVPDSEMRLILLLRYDARMPWKDVAKELNSTSEAVRSKDKMFFQKFKSDTARPLQM